MPHFSALVGKLAGAALDLMFPVTCLGCNRYGRIICDSCAEDLPRLLPPFCPLCAQPGASGRCPWCASATPFFDGIIVPYLMQGLVREAVHAFKYRNTFAASGQLAELLAAHLIANPLPADVIAPIPLHSRRLRERGYNQAGLLARDLGKLTGIPVDEALVIRVEDTPQQARTASREARRENVSGSFRSTANAHGLSVILVDDVVTTGATMSACAGALKAGGADRVWGLALAREAPPSLPIMER